MYLIDRNIEQFIGREKENINTSEFVEKMWESVYTKTLITHPTVASFFY